jgi:uncharacterized protein YaiI (UPF0178 family)
MRLETALTLIKYLSSLSSGEKKYRATIFLKQKLWVFIFMQIYVDGDGIPTAIKKIIFKGAIRTRTPIKLVANKNVELPSNELISFQRVMPEYEETDKAIVEQILANDVLISSDIWLIGSALQSNAIALTPHGRIYRRQYFNNFDLGSFCKSRGNFGIQRGGPGRINNKVKRAFAGHLDSILR